MAGVSEARLLTIAALKGSLKFIQPCASHVESCVSIAVGNSDISSVLNQRGNCSKVCIGCSSMQCSATKGGSCIGAFPTLQAGEKLILKVFRMTKHLRIE